MHGTSARRIFAADQIIVVVAGRLSGAPFRKKKKNDHVRAHTRFL